MASSCVVELSFPMPKTPHIVLHGLLTFESGYVMVHLTTSEFGQSNLTRADLGSFVYAMPNFLNSMDVISTSLCATGSSIDYATRLSKLLARKTKSPVYVSCSMSFAGVTTDEELHGLERVVKEIMAHFQKYEAQK